jgi:hypothetical protein
MGTCDDDRSQAPSIPDGEAATTDNEGTVDPIEEQQDIWAQTEGYTPLSDVHYSSLMVSIGPSDGEDNSEEEVGAAEGGWRSSGGAFFVDSYAFSTESGDDQDEAHGSDDRVTRISNTTSTQQSPVDDFERIAGRALSLLDDEYERTINGNRKLSHEHNPVGTGEASVDDTISHVSSQEQQGRRIIAASFDDQNLISITDGFVPEWENLEMVPATTTFLYSESLAGKAVNVDAEAVRKVVYALSLKANNSFQRKFIEWEQQHQALPSTHCLIPLTPYKAFRRTTDKAKQATAALSRSATLAEAMCRLRESDLLPLDQSTLIIDVVGVDHVECESAERIQAVFRPIIRWIGIWKGCKYEHVNVRLVGRDLVPSIQSPVDLLTPKTATMFQSAYATCHPGVYHQWLSESNDGTDSDSPAPLVVIAYNSGIWGYNEWQPTIEYLCKREITIPFVSTAYTLEECQEDFDAIEASVKGQGQAKVLWKSQLNPFGSKIIRDTKSRSNEYRENAAWQAWLLGGGAIDDSVL